MKLVFPSPELCTDNAAMIAWTGLEMYNAGYESMLDILPLRKWRLQAGTEPKETHPENEDDAEGNDDPESGWVENAHGILEAGGYKPKVDARDILSGSSSPKPRKSVEAGETV